MEKEMINDGKKSGFTLAEVLITLTIIGVIAAITIPNLMQRYQEHATVNKVKKFHTNFSHAYALAVKEYGSMNDLGWVNEGQTFENSQVIFEKLFKPYFKISKDCGQFVRNNQCASILPDGRGTKSFYSFLLDDGSGVVFVRYSDTLPVLLYYDVNGKKGPNEYGKDVFAFFGTQTTVLPFGMPQKYKIGDEDITNWWGFEGSCLKDDLRGCTAWVVYKGNMDYLHCKDLSWNGKNKCK